MPSFGFQPAQVRSWALPREDERRVCLPSDEPELELSSISSEPPPRMPLRPSSPASGSSKGLAGFGASPLSGGSEGSREPSRHGAGVAGARPLLQVLGLDPEALLQSLPRWVAYRVVHGVARLLPALVIYGGTLGLLTCAIFKYRWGLLLALTLYTVYMFVQCASLLAFSFVGLWKVYNASETRWRALYAAWWKTVERPDERLPLSEEWQDSACIVDWHHVQHVVVLPSYRTPLPVLEETLRSLERFYLAKTNLGVVLALEQREPGVHQKASALEAKFGSSFRFMLATYHPADLPNHVPGKSSNECYAFQELCRFLESEHGINRHDPSVVVTVMDDDSEFHPQYFEALTYYFCTAPASSRYTTTWQPPVCHMKNYLRQPAVVRVSSLYATLSELACLANPLDCHVNYSSYSLSLALASAVGGWDPEYLAEDWHMFAKCSLMTGGRVRCKPIFLPLMNYTPEEDSYLGTCWSRWEQAKRHALGVSELVYVIQGIFLGMLELRGLGPRLIYFWRLCPLLAKFTQVHFVNGMSAVLSVLAQLVIHFYMWRSWCYVASLEADAGCGLVMNSATQEGIAQEQIVLNSWMVHWQQRITACMALATLLSGGLGAFYFHLVRDRVEGDLSAFPCIKHPLLHWVHVEVSITAVGWLSSLLYGAAPLWIAVSRILCEVRFTHVVAGMVGRSLKFET